jgi:glycerol-3-phosphate acyltransferase PlsY
VGHILTALVSYLLGSVPTGFLIAKARGLDIRTTGSGNIGATNVVRQFGIGSGMIVLLADVFKGWLAVAVVAHLFWNWFEPGSGSATQERFEIIAGIAAVLGHNFTCWLNFKGGKGIATSAGVLLALVPLSLLIIFCVWVVVFAASRYVSLASICASLALPFATWLTGQSTTLIAVTSAMSALAVFKHKSNIERLIKGTESRFGSIKTTPQPTQSGSKP